MKYEMERDLLDELCAQHHESGWREGYEQCRREMTEECDRRIREAERGGLADVGDRSDEPVARGRHLRVGRPHEVVSVTAGLRHYVGLWRSTPKPMEGLDAGDVDAILEDVLHFADRIDAEHERQLGVLYRDMSDAEWVRLPKDADGEPIHVGDVMDGYGKTIEVVELRYGRSGWVLISRDGNGYADTFAFAHHHATTVEDVLREFALACEDAGNAGPEVERIAAEYAAKLQLKESE